MNHLSEVETRSGHAWGERSVVLHTDLSRMEYEEEAV
jgi:hypothetical protein